MGNDGGSIPTRRELVKDSKKGPTTSDLFQSKQLNSEYLWSVCAYSERPLEEPIVSDYKGRLYNKEAILEMLLDQAAGKSTKHADKVVPHIKSLKKDVVELHFSKSENSDVWICPLTQKEIIKETMGSKFVYLAGCGHVFSEKGYKELNFSTCYVCDKEVDREVGIVAINPTLEADVKALEARMATLKERGLAHSLISINSKKRKEKSSKSKEKSTNHKKKKQRSGSSTERIQGSVASPTITT